MVYLSFRQKSKIFATSLVRGRHCGGKVPSEVKLLRCEVASQRNGGEGGTVKATPHYRGLGAELLMCSLIIAGLDAELLLGSL